MGTLHSIIQALFVLSGIILVILILLRKSDVSGLSGAFGGVGGDTAFGVKTQKQLDKIITYISIFFMVSAVMLNMPALRVKGQSSPTDTPAPIEQPQTPKTPQTPVEQPQTPQAPK